MALEPLTWLFCPNKLLCNPSYLDCEATRQTFWLFTPSSLSPSRRSDPQGAACFTGRDSTGPLSLTAARLFSQADWL